MVILVISRTELKLRSPFAANSVAKGGSSALFTVSSSSPSVVNAISSTRAVAAGGECGFESRRVRRVEIEHLERAVAVTGIEPPAVRHHAVGPGMIVVHGAGVGVEHDALRKGPCRGSS